MIRDVTEQLAEFVTTHNRLVILLVVVLTAGVAFGLAQDQGGADQSIDDDALGDTEVFQASEYIEERYGSGDEDEANLTTADVYVLAEEENALSREALLTAIEFQQDALEQSAVSEALVDDGVSGGANLVGTRLAEDPDADLLTQYETIEDASEDELLATISATFDGGEETAFYLPTTYETGSTESDALRMTFTFEETGETNTGGMAQSDELFALADTADGYDSPAVFVDGAPAFADVNEELLNDAAWLVIPAILLMLLLVLGFAYRDLTDVLIGFTGTVFALIWTAGLMGWMGLLNQQTAIIAPVLVAALSIDFGFHVFMRYREYRKPEEGVRAALSRSTAAVTVAFVLVTVTAAIGFLSNQISPVGVLRDLGVAITLGVVAALVIFTTLVPALKVSADGLWERFGFDRRKTALGKGGYLSRVLSGGAVLAQRGAVAVIAVALIAGLLGGLAFTELDREAWQEADFDDVPEWQTNLPGPLAFEAHQSEPVRDLTYVQNQFQSDQSGLAEGGSGFTTMLIEGDNGVATEEAMTALDTGHDAAADADSDIVLQQDETVPVNSPLSLMEQVAAEDEEFAASFEAADTTGNGVPDSDLEPLYDELFELVPEEAAQVIERTDDGSYESMLLFVPAQQESGSSRADVMYTIADEMADESGHAVTAVGVGTFNDAEMSEISEGIVWTLLLAMAGVLVALTAVYRVVHGSFTLGLVTVVPIALALGLVFGGMYLVGQPLTLVTALLVSITVGLGIDYNIHISDRFGQELEQGADIQTALEETVTGTGGALLGSATTSGGAFSLLVLVPEPQLTSFGIIVALALTVSFLLSVFVLPSLLWLWGQYGSGTATRRSSSDAVAGDC